MSTEHLAEIIAGPRQAPTREEWEAAWARMRAACDETPLAARLGSVRLPYFGAYTLRQVVGASGVLAIAAAILAYEDEPARCFECETPLIRLGPICPRCNPEIADG